MCVSICYYLSIYFLFLRQKESCCLPNTEILDVTFHTWLYFYLYWIPGVVGLAHPVCRMSSSCNALLEKSSFTVKLIYYTELTGCSFNCEADGTIFCEPWFHRRQRRGKEKSWSLAKHLLSGWSELLAVVKHLFALFGREDGKKPLKSNAFQIIPLWVSYLEICVSQSSVPR